MGMPTASIAENPTSSGPAQSGKGAGLNPSMQPSNMTLSATSGQPQVGQPNPYPNTTGSWDNSSTQQSPIMPQMGGKGKGA
jgi:hypothetical protein